MIARSSVQLTHKKCCYTDKSEKPSVQRDRGGFDIGSIMALEAGSGRVGHRPLVATQPNATEEAFLFVALVAIVVFSRSLDILLYRSDQISRW